MREGKSTPPEWRATPRRRRRRQPYKRCAASVRQKNCRSSFFQGDDLLHERFEARIAAQIVQKWVDFDYEKVICLAALIRALQLIERPFFFTQAEINKRQCIRRHVT